MDYIHQRNISGIHSCYLNQWADRTLEGLYLIKHTLPDPQREEARSPVFLVPGVFDPVRGEYGEDLVRTLVKDCGCSAVYEAHFQSQGECGLLDIESVLSDLTHLCLHQEHSSIMIGLSGGAMSLGASLLMASKQHTALPVAGALLISPYFTGYDTLFFRYAHKILESEESLRKITRHSGHDKVPQNIESSMAWYETSELKQIFESFQPGKPNQDFTVPVETKYFRFDIFSRKGRAKLRAMFNSGPSQKPFPGLHRGLFRVKTANEEVSKFVMKYSKLYRQQNSIEKKIA